MDFEEIWKSYYSRLIVFCTQSYRLSKEDAEDTVQETLAKVYKNLRTYSREYSLSTWIYTIARNSCIDFLRKTCPAESDFPAGTSGEDFFQQLPDTGTPGPEEQFSRNEARQCIESFLKRLSPGDREIVYLKIYEKLSYRKISAITGRPAGTLKYRFFSIRKQLRTFLGEVYEKAEISN